MEMNNTEVQLLLRREFEGFVVHPSNLIVGDIKQYVCVTPTSVRLPPMQMFDDTVQADSLSDLFDPATCVALTCQNIAQGVSMV